MLLPKAICENICVQSLRCLWSIALPQDLGHHHGVSGIEIDNCQFLRPRNRYQSYYC